jgi:hypothetical protein
LVIDKAAYFSNAYFIGHKSGISITILPHSAECVRQVEQSISNNPNSTDSGQRTRRKDSARTCEVQRYCAVEKGEVP